MSRCDACGTELRRRARFCPTCGAPSDAEVERRSAREAQRTREESGALRAIAVVFVGTIVAIVTPAILLDFEEYMKSGEWVYYAMLVPAAALALRCVGPGSLRASLGGGCAAGWLLAGATLGLVSYGFSHLYVEGLYAALGLSGDAQEVDLDLPPLWFLLLSFAILPALVEEFFDRGVLWEASSRVLTPTRTLLLTSLLFAVMHGLQGSYLVYPHRFVGGLVMGWMRLRTGSLLPGMVAHFVHNGTWVVLVAQD